MHSAVAQHNDMCKQPMILGDSTNLCLQAETDMITTDEGRQENGGKHCKFTFVLGKPISTKIQFSVSHV